MSAKQNGRLAIFLATVMSLLSACDSDTNAPVDLQTESARQQVAASTRAGSGLLGDRGDDIAPARPVVAETLPYAEVDEQLVYGHFAFPADMVDPLPGIIIIHERWGLDDGVRNLADRIAGQGFVVLAVDLYGGSTATDIADARDLMVRVLDNRQLANQNIRQAYNFLIESGQAPRIGSLGWSFGGGWALSAAALLPDELDAAVIYYGQVTENEEWLAPITAPVLGLFGAKDRGVTVAVVRSFEAAMERLDKDYEIEIYPDAGHAFADPGSSNYNAGAAKLAWTRMLEFLNTHLVNESE